MHELEFHLDEPVDRPLIQYSLCNVNGEVVFGTNSELLGTTLPRLGPGVTSIESPRHYLFSFKIICYPLAWRALIPLIRSYRSTGCSARSASPLLEETPRVLLGARRGSR
jgi:hypothetical protein